MAATFELEIATPERLLLKEAVSAAQIPIGGNGGEIGVLPGHAALISELGIGQLQYTISGETRKLAVAGGIVEVLPDHVRVLAMVAEKPSEIDRARAEAALKRANERLSSVKENVDAARALNAMQRAQARLNVAGQ
jgi:F-type H+-transporting ATPase subunit epsilon